MGSRLTNTSWCWSPRTRAPETVPPVKKKSFRELDDERQLRKEQEYLAELKFRMEVVRDYDHLCYNET
uniref:Uncharacterized protein n=1 Tax=viral metagenome TaxID=1070528 RepID=A0A6C0AJN0_9ZZZZ